MLNWLCRLAILLLLSGCDVSLEKLDDLLTGRKKNDVVLASAPTVVGSSVRTFATQEPMEVVGADAAVCFVLKGGAALQDQESMQAAFKQATAGLNLEVDLVQPDGTRLRMGKPYQAWRLYGKVLKREELSVCVGAPCGTTLPVGGIRMIEAAARPDFPVQGIYWSSEQTLAELASPTASAAASSSPRTGGLQSSTAQCGRRG